jgi:uncharacterized OsmC-like protein
MANTAEVIYKGDLRCEARHVHSGATILTDAPTDNLGKGEAFSPTDLLATSLACCALTTIAIIAKRDGLSLDISGARTEVVKVMASGPRRVAEIQMNVILDKNYTEEEKKLIEHTFENCPVARSLHPDLKQVVKFKYP